MSSYQFNILKHCFYYLEFKWAWKSWKRNLVEFDRTWLRSNVSNNALIFYVNFWFDHVDIEIIESLF
jgi:hypothetical protein